MRFISAIMLTVVGIFATSAQGIDVTYFHGKQRCVTCMSIERLTKEVLNKHYAQELKNGKLKFKIVDISTESGKKLAKEYRITWSALFIEDKSERKDLTRCGFQYAKKQPEVFKQKLKAEIDALMHKK